MEILLKLLIGHALADFALQTDWIANNKSRHAVPKGYNPALHGAMQTIWPYVMSAHALIHAGAVLWATGSPVLAGCEAVAHWVIDFGKCERWYGIHADQAMHFGFKVLWACLASRGVA